MNQESHKNNIYNLARIVIAVLICMLILHREGAVTISFYHALGLLLLSFVWFIMEKVGIVDSIKYPLLSLIPISMDILFVSYFVISTGSIYSPFIIGYYYIILVASHNKRAFFGFYAVVVSFLSLLEIGFISRADIMSRFDNSFGHIGFLPYPVVVLWVLTFGFGFIRRISRFQFNQNHTLIERLNEAKQDLEKSNSTISRLLADFRNQSNDWFIDFDEDLNVISVSCKECIPGWAPKEGENLSIFCRV